MNKKSELNFLPIRNQSNKFQQQDFIFPLPDHRHLLEENISSKTKVEENYRVMTWGKNFPYTKINPEDLHSVFLDTNSQFLDLLNLIHEYNLDVQDFNTKQKEIRNGPWRSCFIKRLHQTLREVILTKDREVQIKFLNNLHNWSMDQLNRIDTTTTGGQISRPTSSRSQNQEILPIITSKQKKPQSALPYMQRKKNSNMIQQQGGGSAKDLLENNYSNITVNEHQRPASSTLLGNVKRPISAVFTEKNKRLLSGQGPRPKSGKIGGMVGMRPISGGLFEEEEKIEEVVESEGGWEQVVVEEEEEFQKILEEEKKMEKQKQLKMNEPWKMLPSEFLDKMMEDYRNKHRTKHENVMPPPDRLKNYKRKVLKPVEEIEDPPPFFEEKTKTLADLAFNKPIEFEKDPEELEMMRLKEEERKKKALAKKKKNAPARGMFVVAKKKKKILKKKKKEDPNKLQPDMKPDFKHFVDDDILLPSKYTDEEKLKGKFETRSTYLHYVPSDNIKEMEMEKLWLKNRHKDVKAKRQDEEMKNLMNEWSLNKGNINTQIDKKIQSISEGSKFVEVKFVEDIDKKILPLTVVESENKEEQDEEDGENYFEEDDEDEENLNFNEDKDDFDEKNEEERIKYNTKNLFKNKARPFSCTAFNRTLNYHNFKNKILEEKEKLPETLKKYDISNIENDKSRIKLNDLKKVEGEIIRQHFAGVKDDELTNIPKSMSIYRTEQKKLIRPFSAILQKAMKNDSRKEQIDEIEAVKKRLAKDKKNLNMKVLNNALLVPEGLIDDFKLNAMPKPGSQLILNPFFKGKKKKKKRKIVKKN